MISCLTGTLPPSCSVLQIDEYGRLRHFLAIAGLSKAQFSYMLDVAESFIADDSRSLRKIPLLRGKTIVNTFFEASTRTRSAFELAAKRLSADFMNFHINTAALQKGESLLDTLKNIHAMGVDMFIVRHPDSGAAEFIARHLGDKVAVVNAGDGSHAHPTQALLDMLTVRKIKGGLKSVKVAIVGDILHSRVARSEIIAMTLMGVKEIRLIAPRTLLPTNMDADNIYLFTDLDRGLQDVDVVIILRLQRERMTSAFIPSEREYYLCYGVTAQRLRHAQPDVIVMHPGPVNRGVEISSEVADGFRSVLLQQVGFGVAARMAVMSLILGRRGSDI